MKTHLTNFYKKHPQFPRIGGFMSLGLVLAFVLSFSSQAVMAIGGKFDAKFYSANNISYYNANENDCTATSTVKTGGNNKDYAGNEILTKAQIQALADNQRFYETAGDLSDIPWQLLAAIHYRETGFKRVGPANKAGPYQLRTTDYPVAASYSDEQFLDATKKAAVSLKALSGDKDLTDQNVIKNILFIYDGRQASYIQQASSLGFDATQAANGDGSPYVMNRADVKRDPTVSPTKDNSTWGQINASGTLQFPATKDYGAYIIYASLTGFDADSGECSSGELISGGMDLVQAKAFMESYKSDGTALNFLGGADTDCSGGALANCTSFSNYFINKYSKARSAGGNGIQVVGNMLAANPSVKGGTEPKPYAVFSKSINPSSVYAYAGHTGVILGVNASAGTVIVGEAVCGRTTAAITATEYTIADFTQYGTVQYGYLGDVLQGSIQNV